MYTKKYLEYHNWEYRGIFAYISEIWVLGSSLILVDINTRKITFRVSLVGE